MLSAKSIFQSAVLIFFALPTIINAQVNVAVSDFLNKSNTLFLDAWERNVPEILRSQLSANEQIIVLDRKKMDQVLEEQALSLSGLSESGSAQNIGKLLNADFILSGTIDQRNDEFVISADLIRVKTGEVQTELVRSKNKDLKNEMVDMLSNNLLFRLTGEGKYQDEIVFKSNSIWYWTGTTLFFSGAALFTNNYYNENLDKYRSASQLKEFDTYHENASISKNVMIGLASAAGIAWLGTLVDLIQGDEDNKVTSAKTQRVSAVKNNIHITGRDEIIFNVQIHF
jgi:TolB-like protein